VPKDIVRRSGSAGAIEFTRFVMISTRRIFLMSAPLAGRAARAASPNDRIRVGIAGIRGRGYFLAQTLHGLKSENVEVAAICDVDATALAARGANFEKLSGRKPATHGDMRRMIEDRSLDAILHATPTNWHALGGIWTLQAGKDAYIEKPLALTLEEGRLLVKATQRYQRIVQHGTQCRSSPEILEARDQIRRGVIGEVYMARGVAHKYRPSIGKLQPVKPPASLDYDMWRGPAPMIPYSANQVHYLWHWFWDTGNGDMGNLAVHGLDSIRMLLDIEEMPTMVQSMGGDFVFHDDARECPTVQTTAFRFGSRKLFIDYSLRNGYSNTEAGMGEAIPFTMGDPRDSCAPILLGSEGFMIQPDYISYRTYLGRDRKPGPSRIGTGPKDPAAWHLANFLKAMRSRKTSDLTADVEQGRKSSALCHLSNIAYRVGRTLRIDPKTEEILGDAEAARLASRACRAPYQLPAV
jgi:predicted dehydrogenase